MINYKTKFAGYYIVFIVAIGMLVGVASRLIIAALLETVFKESANEIRYVVQVVIQTISSILVLYLGIKPSANFAAKKEDIPEIFDMKKFIIIFFVILAIIQVVYNIVNYMDVMEQINEFKDRYSSGIIEKLNSQIVTIKILYIVSSFALVIAHIIMIPITLKKYDDV